MRVRHASKAAFKFGFTARPAPFYPGYSHPSPPHPQHGINKARRAELSIWATSLNKRVKVEMCAVIGGPRRSASASRRRRGDGSRRRPSSAAPPQSTAAGSSEDLRDGEKEVVQRGRKLGKRSAFRSLRTSAAKDEDDRTRCRHEIFIKKQNKTLSHGLFECTSSAGKQPMISENRIITSCLLIFFLSLPDNHL